MVGMVMADELVSPVHLLMGQNHMIMYHERFVTKKLS